MSDSMNAQKAFTVHTMFSQFATKRALGKAMQVASIAGSMPHPLSTPQLPHFDVARAAICRVAISKMANQSNSSLQRVASFFKCNDSRRSTLNSGDLKFSIHLIVSCKSPRQVWLQLVYTRAFNSYAHVYICLFLPFISLSDSFPSLSLSSCNEFSFETEFQLICASSAARYNLRRAL